MSRQSEDATLRGLVLRERYQIEKPLDPNAGVYQGWDRVLARRVAVKLSTPISSDGAVARSSKEALAAAAVEHHNLLTVYDIGSEDGIDYVVTEYLEGRTLAEVLAEGSRLPATRSAEIAVSICAALEAAHASGVTHGDLRPSSILLTPTGGVKVMGFGATPVGGVPQPAAGSPLAEQNDQAGPQRDLRALGLLLSQMLTGAPREPVASLARAETWADGRDVEGAVPMALAGILRRALSGEPAEVFGSAAEMRTGLELARTELLNVQPDPSRSAVEDTDTVEFPRVTGERETTAAAEPAADTGGTRRRGISLGLRLLASYMLLISAALLVAAALAAYFTRTHLSREVDRRLLAAVESFRAGPATRSGSAAALESEARGWLAAQAVPDDQVVAVRTIDGDVLSSSGGIDLRSVRGGWNFLTSPRSRWWVVETESGRIRALSVSVVLGGQEVGTVVAAASLERSQGTLTTLLRAFGPASAIALGLASLLAFMSVRRTLGPLHRITRDVDAIERTGDLTRRVEASGPADEVGRLAGSFNDMLGRLQGMFQSQRRFVSDASHELRTPLTVARGELELLADEVRKGAARRSFRQAVEELDRMARIVDDLLLLARLDEGFPVSREPVEVELVLEEALLRAMMLGRRETSVEAEPGLFAFGDHHRLLQVLTNLVTNAILHAGAGARISLSSRKEHGFVIIEVSDTGPGIAPGDLPHIFRRFFRGSRLRADSPGAGLGLAIAHSLAEAMGGSLEVRSELGAGTTFVLRLVAAS